MFKIPHPTLTGLQRGGKARPRPASATNPRKLWPASFSRVPSSSNAVTDRSTQSREPAMERPAYTDADRNNFGPGPVHGHTGASAPLTDSDGLTSTDPPRESHGNAGDPDPPHSRQETPPSCAGRTGDITRTGRTGAGDSSDRQKWKGQPGRHHHPHQR
ncbi:hypothetical protein FJT64_024786 [Amphibalanus amphitrite]|uniref:Uncharacterized protein n=1 Tax=Amphibalanus amphitrite TaxID=1232801 RepID=A0A6A4WDB0_AMPAM|nr:hypothetical protein FJT64_024786 [Amphibalanus amphitrite]